MTTTKLNLKNMAMIIACFAVCMTLAIVGCKKDNNEDNGGGGSNTSDPDLEGIEFENNKITLKEGETATLKLVAIPEDAPLPKCTYTSDNKDVATVTSAGKVTAKTEGKTTITATTNDGKFSTTCTVTVTSEGGGSETIASGYAGPLEWIIKNNTLTISGNGAMPDYNSTYNITPWYAYGDKFTSVVIQNGATAIGDYSFLECRNFRTISIPNSVNKIGASAFVKCHSLQTITIPSSVILIDRYPFTGASTLSAINVENGNPNYSSDNGVLLDKNKTTLICCPEGKSGSYNIPNGVETIDYYGFSNCQGLTSVTIPNSVTTIKAWALEYCILLSSITFPSNINHIGSWAFRQCRSLTTVTALMPDPSWSAINVDSNCFEGMNLNSCTLKVPQASIGLYKDANPWKEFGTIIGI